MYLFYINNGEVWATSSTYMIDHIRESAEDNGLFVTIETFHEDVESALDLADYIFE